jgi:putative SOS response-associated peptidase YedK
MSSWRELHAFSQPLTMDANDSVVTSTPMRFAHILRLGTDGQREMVPMRWGFADKNAAAPGQPKHMHARGETVDRLPTFANAFGQARGILMVRTFNEGEELPNGRTKQWVITPQDAQPIAIAVICEEWRNGGKTLATFVQVTVPANKLIARITDRMPAILPRDTWAIWLGETGAAAGEVKAVLQTIDDGGTWSMDEQAKPARAPKPAKATPQQQLF